MSDDSKVTQLARRIVAGLNIQPGELIQVRDHVDQPDVLFEVLLAIDLAGATPIIDHQSPAYLNRWLAAATPDTISQSARQRRRVLEQVDRVVSLSGGMPDFALAAPETLAAWQQMDEDLTAIEEARQLPILVVCRARHATRAAAGHDAGGAGNPSHARAASRRDRQPDADRPGTENSCRQPYRDWHWRQLRVASLPWGSPLARG